MAGPTGSRSRCPLQRKASGLTGTPASAGITTAKNVAILVVGVALAAQVGIGQAGLPDQR